MSIKSVLAADSRFQVAMTRAKALEAAKGRCKLYSEEWYALRDMLDEQHKIIASCTAATGEASGMNYTASGDFCHLAAVGSVRFYRGKIMHKCEHYPELVTAQFTEAELTSKNRFYLTEEELEHLQQIAALQREARMQRSGFGDLCQSDLD